MKKLIPILMIIFALTACAPKGNFELPYGATMRQINTVVAQNEEGKDIKIPLVFDERYFNTEEQLIIAKYFYAIQYNDLDVFEEIMLPYFPDYLNAAMETTALTTGDWLQQFYTTAVDLGGLEFVYFEVEVMDYDPEDLTGEMYKVIEFEKSYNEIYGKTEQIVTHENTHAIVAMGKIDEKYIEAKLYITKANDGRYYLMTIS